MNLKLMIYIAELSETIKNTGIALSIFLFILFLFISIIHIIEGKDFTKLYKKLIFLCPFIVICTLCPSKDTIYKIIAIDVAENVIDTESFQDKSDKIDNILNKSLEVIEQKLEEEQ